MEAMKDETLKNFSTYWWGQDFPGYRPHDSTYLAYLPSELPPLNRKFRGDFAWLEKNNGKLTKKNKDDWAVQMPKWQKNFNIVFPSDFSNLVNIAGWREKIAKSPTDCRFPTTLELRPFLSGFLMTFYEDPQGLSWFLYFEANSKTCTLSRVLSSRYSLSQIGKCKAEDLLSNLEISEESCESFLYRMQVENLTWYSLRAKLFKFELPKAWRSAVHGYLDFYDDKKWEEKFANESEKKLLEAWGEYEEAILLKYRKFPEKSLALLVTAKNGKYISHYQNLSESFIERHADKLDWRILCAHQKLSENFIRKYYSSSLYNRNEWKLISEHQSLSEQFISEFEANVDWPMIVQHQKLSDTFLRKLAKKVDWDILSLAKNLPESFIRDHAEKLDWGELSARQTLSENLMSEFQEKIDWDRISRHQSLSPAFVKKFKSKVNWDLISAYQKITPAFFEECKYFLKLDKLAQNDTLTKKEKKRYADMWEPMYEALSEKEIDKHPEDFDFINLCKYKKLSESFINKFNDRIHWYALSSSPFLTLDFIRKYQEKVDWEQISRYQPLTEEFIREFQDRINWTRLSQNEKISMIVLKSFPDKINWNAVSQSR